MHETRDGIEGRVDTLGEMPWLKLTRQRIKIVIAYTLQAYADNSIGAKKKNKIL